MAIPRHQEVVAGGIRPAVQDRHGLQWSTKDLNTYVRNELSNSTNFQKRAGKKMSDKIQEVTEIVEGTTALFNKALDNLVAKESQIVEATKKVSGNVREAADKLGVGLARVEKAADFNKLEKYVDLLERAAAAFTALAELEKTGKLEKIAASIR